MVSQVSANDGLVFAAIKPLYAAPQILLSTSIDGPRQTSSTPAAVQLDNKPINAHEDDEM